MNGIGNRRTFESTNENNLQALLNLSVAVHHSDCGARLTPMNTTMDKKQGPNCFRIAFE